MVLRTEQLRIPAGDPHRDRQLVGILAGIGRLARSRGWDLYLVGGCVRDWLLGKPSYDIDLVVSRASGCTVAQEVAGTLRGYYVALDERYDIGRVAFRNGITCDFATQVGEDLAADLGARDLTINALALPLAVDWGAGWPADALIDPSGGLDDLRRGLVHPASRANLVADPLRLLRIYRFASSLGFQVAAEVPGWIAELAPLLARVASERILKELGEILRQPGAAGYLQDMAARGLLTVLVPEFGALETPPRVDRVAGLERIMSDLPRLFPRQAEALKRYLQKPLGADRPRSVALKLAALLSDLPPLDPTDGRWGLLETIGRRLTLSLPELKLLLRVVQHFRRPVLLDSQGVPPRQIYRFFRAVSGDAAGVLLVSLAAGTEGETPARLRLTRYLLDLHFDPASPIAHPRRWLTGDDLQSHFSLRAGPLIGELLEALAEAQAEGEVHNQEEALVWAGRWLKQVQ